MTDYPSIPYGITHYPSIRREGMLFVDKTRFLRNLESVDFPVLIRPRRFGKSLWVSVLEHYYDRRFAGRFEELFGGTDIGRDPTDERGRYVTLRFNFSDVRKAPEKLEREFDAYCSFIVDSAASRNSDLLPSSEVDGALAGPSAGAKLSRLFAVAADREIPIYVLIDEYDNFANTILAERGEEAYRAFTHGAGFYRDFFATLKAGADTGALRRLFITGVSPVTLDDLTSGFNIGENISLDEDFNELLGFTEVEVRSVLETYREYGALRQDVDEALGVMREWYAGYRFSRTADTSLYNTDMVLYYLKRSLRLGKMPEELIDVNVRIDYAKLRHLLVVGRRLNGNFDLLRHLAGEERVRVALQSSFPLERLARRDNFLSLMYYFGLLSIRGVLDDETELHIANQTVRRLLYGYLRDAYQDMDLFRMDQFGLLPLLGDMAVRGEWAPAFDLIAARIEQHTGIRDYIAGEKVLQGFLAACLSLGERYLFRSEAELGKGYADLALEPDVIRYPQTRYGYLIELKYQKRGNGMDDRRVEGLRSDARKQLRRYLADERLARQYPSVEFIGIVLVFHGWELVFREAVFAKQPA